MTVPTSTQLPRALDSEKSIVEELRRRVEESRKALRGLREPREETVFRALAYIPPDDVVVEGHPLRRVVSIFNPGAVLRGRELLVFPRIIPGYYWYVSAIGFFSIDIEKLLSEGIERPLRVRIAVAPSEHWDLGGCEDARAHELPDGSIALLYSGIKPSWTKFHIYGGTALQSLAVLDKDCGRVLRKGFLKIVAGGSEYIASEWRDSAFIENLGSSIYSFLTRIRISDIAVCWRCVLDLESLSIDLDTLRPNLVNEDWEYKVGWSTNAVKIDSDAYLVGWHGVGLDNVYRNGLAVVDRDGELAGVTNYVLSPRYPIEYYGDRPGVIFGCGLVKYRDLVLWIGGAADHMLAIYVAEEKDVMERVRWIKRG